MLGNGYRKLKPPVSTVAPPPVTQAPFIAKQPPVRLIPFANVEEAVVEVVLSIVAWTPAPNEDVAVVDVELNDRAVTTPVKTPLPVTPNGVPGVPVATPKVVVAMKLVVDPFVPVKPPENMT